MWFDAVVPLLPLLLYSCCYSVFWADACKIQRKCSSFSEHILVNTDRITKARRNDVEARLRLHPRGVKVRGCRVGRRPRSRCDVVRRPGDARVVMYMYSRKHAKTCCLIFLWGFPWAWLASLVGKRSGDYLPARATWNAQRTRQSTAGINLAP